MADTMSARVNKCGDCYFWMKSRECPREKNVDGMSRGPSMGAPACDKFASDTEMRAIYRRSQLHIVNSEPKS